MASFPIRASFEVEYDVRWSEGEESSDPCIPWRTENGRLSVEAQSVATKTTPFQGFAAVNRPRAGSLHFLTARGVPVWAQLTAVGEAEGTVFRSLEIAGGPSGCPGVSDFVPPRTDCRGTRHFDASLTRNPATLIAGFRPFVRALNLRDTLEYSKNTATRPTVSGAEFGDPFTGFRQALLLAVRPQQPLYRRCDTTREAPEYPTFVSLDIRPDDWRALARLRVRRSVVLGPRVARGDCTTQQIPNYECTYRLSLKVTIRRVG